MNVVERVKKILLTPSSEWVVIDGESHTVKDLYLSYLIPLAGAVALATLIGATLWGSGPVTVRLGGAALSGFVLSLVLVWVIAWIIATLAPTFQGQKRFDKAFAVAAFAMTGSLVGGLAAILPAMSTLLMLVGGLYSLYLLYKGLPLLMKSSPDNALGYTAVVVLGAIVCSVVLNTLMLKLSPNPWSAVGVGLGSGQGTEVSIATPSGAVGTTQAKLEEAGRKLEEAARQAERASQAQDPAAIARAATDAIAAIAGVVPGGTRAALTSDRLRAWLPENLAGLPRERFEVQAGTAVGVAGSTASASYGSGERRIELEVLDAGGAAGLLAMLGQMQAGERETESTVERSYQADKRRFTEKRWKGNARSEWSVVLANGVMVSARGHGVTLEALAAAVRGLGLDKLETSGPPARG